MAVNTIFDDGYNPERADSPAAGRYHVSISSIKEDGGRNNEMTVDYEVLAGTVPGQEGKVHRDYFAKTTKAMSRIHQLAIACGMITVEELKKRIEANDPPSYEFERDAVDRQMMIELSENEYNGKVNIRCGFGLYHISDPKCASWPKNAAMLKAAGIEVKQAPAATAVPDNMFEGVV